LRHPARSRWIAREKPLQVNVIREGPHRVPERQHRVATRAAPSFRMDGVSPEAVRRVRGRRVDDDLPPNRHRGRDPPAKTAAI